MCKVISKDVERSLQTISHKWEKCDILNVLSLRFVDISGA